MRQTRRPRVVQAACNEGFPMLEALQKIVRWTFMRAENIFNHTFGDKLNPLYHLGTISFFQFWLVIGSGLYLYIFSETAVHGAFASVERITHNQWWAGGILRSVHRYATDGMILTMLLHLDRLRRAVEKEFPEARSFIRPGFDTGEAAASHAAQPEAGDGV